MTTTRYLVARVAQAFGYIRRNHRMSAAASETHLLREAEAYLGMSAWERVEAVEALSVEYWNLRKLIKERDEVDQRIDVCKRNLDHAHDERAAWINGSPELSQELQSKRAEQLAGLEELAARRDSVWAQAREVRRQYTGLKMKLEVLTHEQGDAAHAAAQTQERELIQQQLTEARATFDGLKTQRDEVGRLIQEGDAALDQIDDQLEALRQARRAQAADAFQVIGEMNKELSQLRAERGVLEVRARQLFSDVGRHLSLHAQADPRCAEAVKHQQGIVDVMQALRRSVILNQKLAGMS